MLDAIKRYGKLILKSRMKKILNFLIYLRKINAGIFGTISKAWYFIDFLVKNTR
jgi:hypothetical protein